MIVRFFETFLVRNCKTMGFNQDDSECSFCVNCRLRKHNVDQDMMVSFPESRSCSTSTGCWRTARLSSASTNQTTTKPSSSTPSATSKGPTTSRSRHLDTAEGRIFRLKSNFYFYSVSIFPKTSFDRFQLSNK